MADRASDIRAALLVAGAVTLLRVLFLVLASDYQLVEDEAHYWLWSKYLDWSYYSKGPGVAWVIALSTRVFGDAEWAIRLPTALLSGVGLVFVALLARDVAREALGEPRQGVVSTPARVALCAVCATVLAPALQVVSVVMTIDGPYVACWAAAAWCGWRCLAARGHDQARRRGGGPAWLGLGLAIAAGFVFKYTMLLLVPGLLAYWWWQRRDGRERDEPVRGASGEGWWMVGGLAIAAAGLAPVLIWNAQHDWPTVKHLLGHLGVAGGDVPMHVVAGAAPADEWSPWWSLELIGQQLGMIGPMLVLGAIAAWGVLRSREGEGRRRRAAEVYLVLCAAPVLAFYLLVSLKTEPEGNWPMAAYVTLLPLAAWRAADELARLSAARRTGGERKPRAGLWTRRLWRAGVWYGVVAALLVHFAGDVAAGVNALNKMEAFASAFARVMGREPRPIVLGRLYGAREMARDVDQRLRTLEGLTNRGAGSVWVIAQHYGRASQLTYYLFRDQQHTPRSSGAGRAGFELWKVHSAMEQTGGRRSQFDLWPDRSLANPSLLGGDALILSNNRPETLAVWQAAFERVEAIAGGVGVKNAQLAGEHKADRFAYIGYRYRGMPRRVHVDKPTGGDAP
jgi:4-amino-4-deoxy-L-arabinose transferase-like glycosyltransferase